MTDCGPTFPASGTPEAFSEALRWWLAHDAERDAAALQARLAVADRTFDNTARRLLDLIGAAGDEIAA